MGKTGISALAREILQACDAGATIASPPSALDPEFDIAAAYAVEAEVTRLRIAQGRRTVGRKVGYANRAMWRVLKLESLVWAHMYDDTVRAFSHNPGTLSLDGYIAPRIEPEIVIQVANAADAWNWIAIGFEIIDCPFPGWEFKPADFVAAFGLHRALVIGEPFPVTESNMPALLEQLATFKLKLFKNDALIEEGAGKNSLKSPALCLAELNRIAPLQPDEIVSTGTLTAAQPIAPGETWEVQVEGLPVTRLTLHLS